MSSDADRTPPEIERDIVRTRGELAQTIDALERKLDVRRIAEKGIEMVNNRFVSSEALNRGLDTMRNNPVPVALIGIGAAWLVASNTGMVDRLANDERVDTVRRRVGELADNVGERASEMASSVAGSIGLSGSSSDEKPLGYTGNPLVDQNGQQSDGWMHQISGVAQDTLRSARDAIEGPVNYATDGAGRIADRVGGALEQHPLAVGAVGVMAGMLIAALLPMTKTETELLGDSSNQLWLKAREAGEDVASRVRSTATQAAAQVATQVAEQAIEAISGDSDAAKDNGDTKPREA
jgi:hypothetical protein